MKASSPIALWSLLVSILICTTTAQANPLGVPDSEYNALVALYNSTGGNNWTSKTNWLTDAAPWKGVTTEGGHVTGIYLDSNSLTGHLPPELGSLTLLKELHLQFNGISGSLPPELGNMAALEGLYLYCNQFTGRIPAELGNLTKLQTLSLFTNHLSGGIPAELGSLANLREMWLHQNQLTGSIPPEFGKLANMQDLDLEENQLTGSIPPELGNLTQLEGLGLASNQLTGSIPSELGNMTNLWMLGLGNNRLTGTIPAELGRLKRLGGFGAYNNMLVGAIPPELGDMTSLIGLGLANNQLTGTIPPTLGNLARLSQVGLSGNQLSGHIPPELVNATELTELNLSDNNLDGQIPPALGSLPCLQELDLSDNNLTGPIPPELGNLPNLVALYLPNNQLSGSIPAELGNMPNLCGLYLSQNQLTGSIPKELGNAPYLGVVEFDDNHLTGTIPPELGNLTYLQTLDLGGNQLTGPLPVELSGLPWLWNLNLSRNRIIGEVPSWVANMPGLMLQLSYNGVRSVDPLVLSIPGDDWQHNQTVWPWNLVAEWTGLGSATLTWTPIEFSSFDGYYEIGFSSDPNGPFVFDPANRTLDKQASSITVSGLDISKPAYFAVRTVSLPNEYNQSTITSESTGAQLETPARNKTAPDGPVMALDGSDDMIVTASFQDCFYVEKANRSWGIRVCCKGQQPALGGRVTIYGRLDTNADGERYVLDATPASAGDGSVQPVYMSTRSVGGSDFDYYRFHYPRPPLQPAAWYPWDIFSEGQMGVDGGIGLNNIGLLVRIAGKFTYIDDHTFTVDDGSGAAVRCEFSSGTIPQSGWQYVVVTGISSIKKSGTAHGRLIRVTSVTPM